MLVALCGCIVDDRVSNTIRLLDLGVVDFLFVLPSSVTSSRIHITK